MSLAALNPQFKKACPSSDAFLEAPPPPRTYLEAPPPLRTYLEAPPPLRTYLWLSVLSCFCPVFPINLLGLVFSVLSRRSYEGGDFDGSRRLGRNALWVGVASGVIGVTIITISLSVHFSMMN